MSPREGMPANKLHLQTNKTRTTDKTIEERLNELGKEATQLCVISCLGATRQLLGSLHFIKEVIAVHGLIHSVPEITGQADVMNGLPILWHRFKASKWAQKRPHLTLPIIKVP